MKPYKVTIHEHLIYDVWVHADSVAEAEELVENSIFEDDRSGWQIDNEAGWIDVGTIYDEDGVEVT
jgi:hypothetical protein